ncbi:hypothetical protein EGW08_014149, partial [Elysia chlorotica]
CGGNTYGSGCSQHCSPNCGGADKACDHINGTCLSGCAPGFQGAHCVDACQLGTYGAACSETCNANCGGIDKACNHISGHCQNGCVDGYQGHFC